MLDTSRARTFLWEQRLPRCIKIGAVIRDSHRRVGIVCSEEPTPTRAWINKLVKSEEVENLGPTKWWGVAPLDGGYVLEAEPLMVYLRDATYDDFLRTIDSQNAAGRDRLVELFPEFVAEFLAQYRSDAD